MTSLFSLVAWGESPVRGKYIQPPASVKPKATPTPTSAAGVPCAPNMTDDTCRIPSSDPISQKPDASIDASSSKKPDAKIDPIKAAPVPSPAPQKKQPKKK